MSGFRHLRAAQTFLQYPRRAQGRLNWSSAIASSRRLESLLALKDATAAQVLATSRHHSQVIGKRPAFRLPGSCLPAYSTVKAAVTHTILEGDEDRYDGILVNADRLPTDPEEFTARLALSIQNWGAAGKRGIWLRINLAQASLIQPAVAAGFDFHHAERGLVILSRWLPDVLPNKLPEGATHQVGIGAFVLNERREVLLVQEGLGSHRGQGIWKLPTGLSNLGEDIPQAAEREVLEETGVLSTFDRLLAVRQSHGHNFGRSDLFFVCGMRLSSLGQEVVLQKDELAAAGWHPMDQVEQYPIFKSGPMFQSIFSCCKAYADGDYKGIRAMKIENGFNPRSDLLLRL